MFTRQTVLWLIVIAPALAQVNVLTANYDNGRTNSNTQETILTPSNVNTATFGKLGTFPVDGQIYAQPLYAGSVPVAGVTRNVVYVATMHNSVYAIDADAPQSDTPLWQVNLGPSVPSTLFDFDDIAPEIGILSTPVIDLSRQVIYVVSDTLDSATQSPVFQLHALSLANGLEVMNGPVTIAATVSGTGAGSAADGTLAFDPFLQLQRPGLALANGQIYLSFGSHADTSNFHGWLIGYDASNLQRMVSLLNTTPSGLGGSIWQSGRAPAIDENGNLYVVTGNGDYDGSANFGESILSLSGSDLTVLDWHTPQNWAALNPLDWDLGTTGAILVPNTNQVLAGAKSGLLYLLTRDAMGHLGPDDSGNVQSVQANSWGLFNLALWNNQSGPMVYLLEPSGALKAFQIVNGQINLAMLSQYTPNPSTYFAGIAVSADGGTTGTGIVWLMTSGFGSGGSPGALHALNASNLSDELWNSNLDAARDGLISCAKFAAPTVVNGRVYVPTFSSGLAIYGLLGATPQTAPTPSYPQITAVANGASFTSGAISPGELVAIYGENFGSPQLATLQLDATNRAATALSDTEVQFDGLAAPLLYTSANQAGAVVPFGLSGPVAQVQILYQGVLTSSLMVPVAQATPALFSADGSGAGPGVVVNEDGTFNSAGNPASPGSVVTLYATGAGDTSPPAVDGMILMSPPYPAPILPVTVSIGNQPADVLYAGAAPWMISGIVQINVRVPLTVSSGSNVPVALQVGNASSSSNVTLAVH